MTFSNPIGLPPRPTDSHKGTFGRALLIGGSRGMTGAIALAGMAAVRSGAGLVRLAVPDCCLETVAGFSPCYMLVPVTNDSSGRICGFTPAFKEFVGSCNCIAIGPGLGRSEALDKIVVDFMELVKSINPTASLVIDADALNALATYKDWRQFLTTNTVLTPHPGEWSRLSGVSAAMREQQEQAAKECGLQIGCTVLLKGQHTLVTDGARTYYNPSGTPAMATGGSGDVLTGVITALICQGTPAFEAARLGAYVHGLAGQMAAEELGTHVVLPTELIDFLPSAFQETKLISTPIR